MPTVATGYTRDGLWFKVYWTKPDLKLRVRFTDEYDEKWIFEDISFKEENGTFYGLMKEEILAVAYSLPAAIEKVGLTIADHLREEGSWIVRGAAMLEELPPEVKAVAKAPPKLPFGRTRLLEPRLKRPTIVVEPEEWVRPIRPPPPVRPPPKVKPKPPKMGLGREEKKRLRVEFESELRGYDIKLTRNLKLELERKLYELEDRFKGLPREEAFKAARNELLKWVEELYFKESSS